MWVTIVWDIHTRELKNKTCVLHPSSLQGLISCDSFQVLLFRAPWIIHPIHVFDCSGHAIDVEVNQGAFIVCGLLHQDMHPIENENPQKPDNTINNQGYQNFSPWTRSSITASDLHLYQTGECLYIFSTWGTHSIPPASPPSFPVLHPPDPQPRRPCVLCPAAARL